ncbi:MAG: acylphosphatase [Planctomycetaceae bacterium]
MHRIKVLYSGRVQGVGFRWTTQRIGQSHAVVGYVKNLRDGRVELVAEGVLSDINGFLKAIRERMVENIEAEERTVESPTCEYTVFDIRH